MKDRFNLHACILAIMLILSAGFAYAETGVTQDTIKVGVLHSLSGTMAISESVLKDTVLMMIADQNAKGGLLGKNDSSSEKTYRNLGVYSEVLSRIKNEYVTEPDFDGGHRPGPGVIAGNQPRLVASEIEGDWRRRAADVIPDGPGHAP